MHMSPGKTYSNGFSHLRMGKLCRGLLTTQDNLPFLHRYEFLTVCIDSRPQGGGRFFLLQFRQDRSTLTDKQAE